jgi:hypothetical protein
MLSSSCEHAAPNFQTCADNAISYRDLVFLHPVSIIMSVTFDVISHVQDLR